MSGVSLVRKVRLKVGAGAAKPGPAIGQALGPLGLNMAEFCKQFNESTKNYEKEIPLPVELSAFSNRTFTFVVKTPPTSWFLKRCAGIEDGSKRPGHDIVGQVHVKQIYEIAKAKQADSHLAKIRLESLARSIAASASSMGLEVVSDTHLGTFTGSSSSTPAPASDGKKPAAGKADAKKPADAAAKAGGAKDAAGAGTGAKADVKGSADAGKKPPADKAKGDNKKK